MVAWTTSSNGDIAPPVIKASTTMGIPPGDYRLVGWDMDATGKRLVDEICQIAVYTRDSEYAQYVMPFKNLSPPARKRHHLKVVTMGRYRVLKNSSTNKVVPTKSEISALTDFIGWLEKVKGDANDGVILVHHEPRRVNPSMLIDALKKYNLLDKFKDVVKGFANGFDIAKAKCENTLKVFSLRTLSRIFLDKEEELSSAAHRARLALQIVQHLSVGDENSKIDEEIGSGDSEQKTARSTVEFIREFVQSVDNEEKEYAELKQVLARQRSLKPIFAPLFNNMARRKRQHASPLRRLLAESAIDYIQLQEAWTNGMKEGLEKFIKEKVIAEEKDHDDLIEVLECHFDPDKKPPQSDEMVILKNVKKKNFRKIKGYKKKISESNSHTNNDLSGNEGREIISNSTVKPKIDGKVAPEIEEKISPKVEEKIAPEIKEKIAPETEEKIASETEDKIAPETEDKIAPEIEENIAPEIEENIAPEIEEKIAPETEEKVDSETEEKVDFETEEKIAPKIEEKITSKIEEVPEIEKKVTSKIEEVPTETD